MGAALPTAALLTFLTLSAVANVLKPPPPSDWRLIQRFERNEDIFNELRDAVRGEGGLESIFRGGFSALTVQSLNANLHLASKLKEARVKHVKDCRRRKVAQTYLNCSVLENNGFELPATDMSYQVVAGITRAQLGEYQKKMSQLGLTSVSERDKEPQNVTFEVKHHGFSVQKDYVYLYTLPAKARLVKKIRAKDVETFGEVYRTIRDGWYLHAYRIYVSN